MIFTIIPVHNNLNYTKECILSLNKQSYRDFKIIVIDDGSTDGTDVMIKENFSEVTLLKGDGNLWWAGATNLGIALALKEGKESDYILTLNNDLVVKENYLTSLMDSAETYKNSLVGSVSVDIKQPDVIDDGGVIINFWTAKYHPLNKGKLLSGLDAKPKNHIEVSTLPGRGTLIPLKVFKKIGTYNYIKLPHYGADYELAIRAKNYGFPLFVSYDAVVYSYVEHTGLGNKNRLGLLKYFFNIKSPSAILGRVNFATCITKNPFMLTCYIVFDFIRNTSHYFKQVYICQK